MLGGTTPRHVPRDALLRHVPRDAPPRVYLEVYHPGYT